MDQVVQHLWTLLAQVPAQEAAVTGLGMIVFTVVSSAFRGWWEARQKMAAMQRIPASHPKELPPDASGINPVDLLRERVALLETQLRFAQADAAEARREADDVSRDYGRTASQLTQTRDELERAEVLIAEQKRKLDAVLSGHHPIPPSYPPQVLEIDDRPTPQTGKRRYRP